MFAAGACLIDPKIGELGDIDTAKLVLRSSRGVLCVISNSRRTGYGYDQRVELFGSNGALRVDNVPGTTVSSVWTRPAAAARHSLIRSPSATPRPIAPSSTISPTCSTAQRQPSTGPRDSLRALAPRRRGGAIVQAAARPSGLNRGGLCQCIRLQSSAPAGSGRSTPATPRPHPRRRAEVCRRSGRRCRRRACRGDRARRLQRLDDVLADPSIAA